MREKWNAEVDRDEIYEKVDQLKEPSICINEDNLLEGRDLVEQI